LQQLCNRVLLQLAWCLYLRFPIPFHKGWNEKQVGFFFSSLVSFTVETLVAKGEEEKSEWVGRLSALLGIFNEHMVFWFLVQHFFCDIH